MSNRETPQNIPGLTAKIVSAYVSHNPLPTADLPSLVSAVHSALVGGPQAKAMEPRTALVPAVPVKKSVKPNYIICLEDGLKFKSLKRHLGTAYGMTPAQYREKWGLPPEYPMVAPNYAKTRSAIAKGTGLGRRQTEVEVQDGRAPKSGATRRNERVVER